MYQNPVQNYYFFLKYQNKCTFFYSFFFRNIPKLSFFLCLWKSILADNQRCTGSVKKMTFLSKYKK